MLYVVWGVFLCCFFLHKDRYRIGNEEVCYDLCSVRMRIVVCL